MEALLGFEETTLDGSAHSQTKIHQHMECSGSPCVLLAGTNVDAGSPRAVAQIETEFNEHCAAVVEEYEAQRLTKLEGMFSVHKRRVADRLLSMAKDDKTFASTQQTPSLIAAALSALDVLTEELVTPSTWATSRDAWIGDIRAANSAQLKHIARLAAADAEKKSTWTRQRSQEKLANVKRAASSQSQDAQQALQRRIQEKDAGLAVQLSEELAAFERAKEATRQVNGLRVEAEKRVAQQQHDAGDRIKKLQRKLSVVKDRARNQRKHLEKLKAETKVEEELRDQLQHRLDVCSGVVSASLEPETKAKMARQRRALDFHNESASHRKASKTRAQQLAVLPGVSRK